MRRSLEVAVLVIGPLLAAAVELRAVIVDRVAIAVGNKVITQSEIEQSIRLTAFEAMGTADFTLASRKQAAQKMINQRLIEKEMDVGRFPHVTAERAKVLLAAYEKANYPSSHAALMGALKNYGLSDTDLEENLARREDFAAFLDLRFRPAVNVDDQEVRKYFDEKTPASERQLGLNALRPRIEMLLANERADRDLDDWLKDQRKRTRIVYVDMDLAE